jgi:DNA-binding CsgD family transcriptional regulator/PAS domain-containing protein
VGLELDGIYGAIGDDEAFGKLSNRIAEAVGTRSAIFVELNAAGTADYMQLCYWSDEFTAYYAEHFAHIDPWTQLAIDVGHFGRAAALDAVMSPQDFARTAMRNDCFRRFGDDTGRCLGVMPALGRPGLMVATHKAERDVAFGAEEAARLDEVYGHLKRAIHLHRMFERERDKVGRLQDLADQSEQGLVRVDRDLRVLSVSASAKAILDQRDGLTLHQNRIVAAPALEGGLRGAVAGVIDKVAEARTGFLCHRPSGLRPYRIVVLPAGFASEAGAILKIHDPEMTPPPGATAALQSAYGLSAMETALAEGLVAEQSLEEIAAARAVGRETIKTQLKSLFNKTGVNRQSSLVKLLATFPRPWREG